MNRNLTISTDDGFIPLWVNFLRSLHEDGVGIWETWCTVNEKTSTALLRYNGVVHHRLSKNKPIEYFVRFFSPKDLAFFVLRWS